MSRELQTNDMSPNGKTSRKGLKSFTRPSTKKTRGRLRLGSHSKVVALVDDSDEDNDSEVAEEDEQTTDANDEDVIAPSGRPNHKRGHQTGLSVSLSNATIASGNRKRTWSNRVQEEDNMKRPVKISREEPSSSEEDDDSDAGYEGIDLISESGDDDMEKEEEELIVRSEEEDNDDGNDNEDEEIRPDSSSSSASWEGFESNGTIQESGFFAEHFERTNTVQEGLTKAARKVRFVDEVTGIASSSPESTDSEDDFFPDLMIQQDQLDPRFRAILEKESDSEGSYWDLGYGDTAVNDESEEEGSSSGYESDEGETTDEEILPPPTIRPQSSQNANAKSPSRTPQKSTRRGSSTPNGSTCRQGPSLASWTVDPAKPYAIVDKSGSNMIFYPAQRPQSKAIVLSRNDNTNVSPSTYTGEPDKSDEADQQTFSQSSATVMMSGFHDNYASIGKLFGSHIVGPPEAFFPWRSVDTQGQVTYDDEDYEDDDDLDIEENLDINDFIDFGDSSGSDGEEEANEEEGEERSTSEQIMPRHATAFRRNQLRVQAMSRQPRTFKADTVVKTGRLDSANQPISPLRKQKQRTSLGIAPSTRRITSISNA